MYTLGIDMGGTHTAIGLVQERKILCVTEFPTRTENGVDSYTEELILLKVNWVICQSHLMVVAAIVEEEDVLKHMLLQVHLWDRSRDRWAEKKTAFCGN